MIFFLAAPLVVRAQGTGVILKKRGVDEDHVEQRSQWFLRGRLVPGKSAADLRQRALQAKLKMRAQRAAAVLHSDGLHSDGLHSDGLPNLLPWIPLGPVPLASDATGNGTQDYHQVAGRATAIAIDPADSTGNTVYIGAAQGGIWKTTNGAASAANGVAWTAVADDAPTLSIGAIAIQPGNNNPANSVILAATGEANNSTDSYFGLGILRSTNGGGTWSLISTANAGALSFSGLGGARMAFSTASNQTSTVVSAMATSSEGQIDGAITSATVRGLYTSLDAGQTWTYDALTDGNSATDAVSATSVVYNASAGLFFAAVRYHGFYSSPDGVTWIRLASQPGGAVLSTSACPPVSTSNNQTCPIYRGEMAVVPGRNEMYAWYVSVSPSNGSVVDGGMWQSLDGGASWTAISDSGVTNCGDIDGCGVEEGTYNLELAAVPDGSGTDLYAGAVNLYKCSISSQNPACASPFINLTHVYGCDPIGAPAHVHPDQHALAFVIPGAGSDAGNDLMYFANDGGIYRALDGYGGLTTGSCTGTNAFDDLNQNLGSITQFVSFSEHPSDPNTLLGGTEGNGSPATGQATTNPAWGNVLGGDGGYNAIDPNAPTNFYASNPDAPPGGLGIQLCIAGVNCNDGTFSFVVTSDSVGGDDGAFYFPYILDPQSTTALLVGTCRVWRGPRLGGAYTVLSPNFDQMGSGTCTGSEVNQVQAIAAGGLTDGNGSLVVYATTSGYGPLNGLLYLPIGGHVWVTTNATAGPASFVDVTGNGPAGNINPNQFSISAVAMDTSDKSGATAYVTIMGFTGGAGHVWKTVNFGGAWTDFTGNLPDSPVNAVVVDPANATVYVGTDVGVFVSSTNSGNWMELGPGSGAPGFLPDVPVTALELFNSGGEELLRASTYGRGVWQNPIAATPEYQLAISNSPLTAFPGQTVIFNGTAASINDYSSSVALSCVAGTTAPPGTCTISPSVITPGANVSFTVTVVGTTGDYNFNIQGVGSDPHHVTQQVAVSLQIVSFALGKPAPTTVTVPRGTQSPPAEFQITASGSFNQSVTVSCTAAIANSTCNLVPGTTVNPTAGNPVSMAASVMVPAATAVNSYTVTIQAATSGVPAPLSTAFALNVTTNPTFLLTQTQAFPEVNAGSTGTSGPIAITSQDGFQGTVALSCAQTFGQNSCGVTPGSVTAYPATASLVINGASFTAGSYSLALTGTSGSQTQSVNVPFNVGDYTITGMQPLSAPPTGQVTEHLTLTSEYFYAGKLNVTCDATALAGAQCVLSPSGMITMTSGGTAILTVTINIPNNAVGGNYNINIVTEDATGAPAHTVTIPLTVTEDFELTSTTTSQTVSPGQTTGPYNLTIQPVGSSFNAAVTLSCSGLPSGAQCLFSPSAPVTPGNSAQSVVMTISTTGSTAAATLWPSDGAEILFATISTFLLLGCRRVNLSASAGRARIGAIAVVLLLITLAACSGVSKGGSGGGGNGQPTPSGSYTVTVTGTSQNPNYSHSTSVLLIVN